MADHKAYLFFIVSSILIFYSVKICIVVFVFYFELRY